MAKHVPACYELSLVCTDQAGDCPYLTGLAWQPPAPAATGRAMASIVVDRDEAALHQGFHLEPVGLGSEPSRNDAKRETFGTQFDLPRGTGERAIRLLAVPPPPTPSPWVFRGNGGRGVKTWLSESHVLEINPHWLNFDLFESMRLAMLDAPPGPGVSGSQEWRSTFTVGVSTDWHLTRAVALRAGYRFYDNPVPADIATGAYPNAAQHVVALGVGVQEGPHSLTLIYGIDMMDAASSAGISSVRHGTDLDPLAHLVSLRYGFTF